MLYVQGSKGQYLPAPQEVVFSTARRLSSSRLRRGALIESSQSARFAIQQKLIGYQYEMFACLFLDSTHRVLAFKEMFRGSINRATVHPREVVKEALQLNASAVVFAHNHPSGESEPSKNDIELTEKLAKILLVVDVIVLDHLIVGESVTSMADEDIFSSLNL